MNDYRYSIYASLQTEKTSSVELGRRFMQTLSDIAKCSSPIDEWLLMPRPFARDSLTFVEASENIEKFVDDNVATVDMQPDIDEGYFLTALDKLGMSSSSIGFSASVGGKFVQTSISALDRLA